MRLLVSVRSAAEVGTAVAGGARIVDAKEPGRGSLGAVDAGTLRAIAGALPPGVPLSVALGDLTAPAALATALSVLDRIVERPEELYVKVGLAGIEQPFAARAVLAAAVDAAARTPLRPDVVAVAYADHAGARALSREAITALAGETGARGVLVDTWIKDGRDIFAWATIHELEDWVGQSKSRGLLTGVAGSLTADGVQRVAALSPDVVGVRGAACSGGRLGLVEELRVRGLANALREPVGGAV